MPIGLAKDHFYWQCLYSELSKSAQSVGRKNVADGIVSLLEPVPTHTCQGGIRPLHFLSELHGQKPTVVFVLHGSKSSTCYSSPLSLLYLVVCETLLRWHIKVGLAVTCILRQQ